MKHYVRTPAPESLGGTTKARNKRLNRCMRDWRNRTLVSTQIGATELSNRRSNRVRDNFLRGCGVTVARDCML